ncbi:3-alpha-hydroxysteroid dehydrogenase [Bradyrhizobium sp. LTSPM299]|uniref:coniferyl-alcohol dehydrogenase n=1 Tax=Bradyrhizobium sp. LTSPM299 TaxID=1619233 RepID=UPI0005CA6D19|nr:coniferyl-alcohol dehydrogenase [Bradyrhizobium sp. LTSPM299]KJC61397.1 3-alpha-hydroxysteroid dehydrogenase [Bradyrhizobium sp. LTSPM299]
MNLLGKTIVITGISSGIGARVAQLASYCGASVYGMDLVAPAHTQSAFVQVDLSSAASIDNAIQQLPGSVDALLNVAGVSSVVGAAMTLGINFYGLRHLTEQVSSRMPRGGSVVNIASIASRDWRDNVTLASKLIAVEGMPDVESLCQQHTIDDALAYPLSKEMVVLWTLQVSQRLLTRSVRVNAISPGPVETPILKEFWATLGEAEVSKNIAAVGRAGTPDDIAPLVLFLTTDAARWVNGVNIPVDGGLDAKHTVEGLGLPVAAA